MKKHTILTVIIAFALASTLQAQVTAVEVGVAGFNHENSKVIPNQLSVQFSNNNWAQNIGVQYDILEKSLSGYVSEYGLVQSITTKHSAAISYTVSNKLFESKTLELLVGAQILGGKREYKLLVNGVYDANTDLKEKRIELNLLPKLKVNLTNRIYTHFAVPLNVVDYTSTTFESNRSKSNITTSYSHSAESSSLQANFLNFSTIQFGLGLSF